MGRFIEFDGQKIDVERQLFEISKAEAEEDLVEFIKQAFHVLERGAPYVHGWHIDFIAAHLMAITDRVELEDGSLYNRLLINIPPGTDKSLILNVFWPAWEWGPRNQPHLRYLCAAHKVENLSARDSRRMRDLILSEWYQERWGDRVKLARDQNEKLNFVNSAGGFRIATSITSLTGLRADRVLIDDPHSVDSAASQAMRETEVTTFLEAIPTRLTNPIESAIVVIMQRLHESDVSGTILDKQLGYDHVMLPMRYDPTRARPTMLGIEDPRQEEGELLFPARFPIEVVERDEKSMGPYAAAGQFQQEPAPRGGEVIKAAWWELWTEEGYPPFDFILASLDTAYTSKQEGDFSALTVWGIFSSDYSSMRADNFVNARGKFKTNADEAARFDEGVRIRDMLEYNPESVPRVFLMGAWQEKLELSALVEKVAKTCRKFHVDKLLVEGKASGLSVAQEIRRLHGNEDWGVQIINPGSLDKLARVYSIQHLFSEGMIYAPDRTWADMVIRQCEVFPKGKNDDLVDTVSQALRHLRETGLLVRAPERMAEIDAGRRHVGKAPAALYPI